MKNVNIQSVILLQSVIRKLIESMEILNRIDEKDYSKIVKIAQKQSGCIKGITDNGGRANLFMTIFFLRELIEAVTHDDNPP